MPLNDELASDIMEACRTVKSFVVIKYAWNRAASQVRRNLATTEALDLWNSESHSCSLRMQAAA